MQQAKTRKIYGLILLSAAVLQFTLLVISMGTSFFFPGGYDMQPQWWSYLLALILLGIAAVGVYQIRTPRETTSGSQRVDVSLGLSLGIISAILLSIPGLASLLYWSALGLPLLIGVLIQSPASISSISPLLALTSVALYVAFAATYSIRAYQATRRSGSVKQGMWSSTRDVMASFLSTTLLFSFMNTIMYFFFHTGSGLVWPSSVPGMSPLANYIASYQDIVRLIATWLLVPVIVGLLIAFISSLIARRTVSRLAAVLAD